MHNLSAEVLPIQSIGPASASSGAKLGAAVDMQGWDGVMYVINIGAITGSGVADAYVVSDDNSSFTSQTNINGAALTQVVNANTMQIIDVFKPTERYNRIILTPAANTVAYSVTAVRYRRSGILPASPVAEQTVVVAQN